MRTPEQHCLWVDPICFDCGTCGLEGLFALQRLGLPSRSAGQRLRQYRSGRGYQSCWKNKKPAAKAKPKPTTVKPGSKAKPKAKAKAKAKSSKKPTAKKLKVAVAHEGRETEENAEDDNHEEAKETETSKPPEKKPASKSSKKRPAAASAPGGHTLTSVFLQHWHSQLSWCFFPTELHVLTLNKIRWPQGQPSLWIWRVQRVGSPMWWQRSVRSAYPSWHDLWIHLNNKSLGGFYCTDNDYIIYRYII